MNTFQRLRLQSFPSTGTDPLFVQRGRLEIPALPESRPVRQVFLGFLYDNAVLTAPTENGHLVNLTLKADSETIATFGWSYNGAVSGITSPSQMSLPTEGICLPPFSVEFIKPDTFIPFPTTVSPTANEMTALWLNNGSESRALLRMQATRYLSRAKQMTLEAEWTEGGDNDLFVLAFGLRADVFAP